MANEIEPSWDELEERISSASASGPHDSYILVALHEAIAAAREGNFGVGAVLVRDSGEIVERGRNHVFHPHFRSDIHAEMDVMTKFEEHFKEGIGSEGLVLYSSLEPCPMCLTRLIISGVSKVYYAAPDEDGGMVHRLVEMPPEFRSLAKRQEYSRAQCSPELSELALQIFQRTSGELNKKLYERLSSAEASTN